MQLQRPSHIAAKTKAHIIAEAKTKGSRDQDIKQLRPRHIKQQRRKHIAAENQAHIYEPRSNKKDLLAIKDKSEIFTEKGSSSCCEQLQKI